MATTEAFVKPDLLRWARLRSHLSQEATAERMNVKPEKVRAWESGDARPSFRQARLFASKLSVPLGYLFLDQPPREEAPLPDLRTVNGQPPRELSPDFREVIYDCFRKQEWYKAYLESFRAPVKEFVGRFPQDTAPGLVAQDMGRTLRIDVALRQQIPRWEDFLREFIAKAESAGVLVMRNGVVGNDTHRVLSVWEFRGFVITDPIAPLVFINGNDAKAAQIFTLAHELAHLWVGASGISNPDYERKASEQNNLVERNCDRIAAELLVPGDEFREWWSRNSEVSRNLNSLADVFKVSRWVVLRRAWDLDEIDAGEYRARYEELREESRDRRTASGGGDFYPTSLLRNSTLLTQALIDAVSDGRTLHRDAAHLLNVKLKTLDGLAAYLSGDLQEQRRGRRRG